MTKGASRWQHAAGAPKVSLRDTFRGGSAAPVARVTSDAVVILPRLARALNAPAVAAALGLILIAVGIIGLATEDIRTVWAIVILIVGLINLVRTMASRNGD
jgi:hypothetical protein